MTPAPPWLGLKPKLAALIPPHLKSTGSYTSDLAEPLLIASAIFVVMRKSLSEVTAAGNIICVHFRSPIINRGLKTSSNCITEGVRGAFYQKQLPNEMESEAGGGVESVCGSF